MFLRAGVAGDAAGGNGPAAQRPDEAFAPVGALLGGGFCIGQRAGERIADGSSISDSFATESLFPSLVVRMLRVGETTGALDEALANVSYFFTRDIEESIERVQALIEPVLTVVLGLILGWIMLAVLGPIYDTISKIRA